MLNSHKITTRRIIIGSIVFGIAFAGVGLYLRSIFRPIPPLLDLSQKQRELYWPIHRSFSPEQKAHVLDGNFVIIRTVDRLPIDLKSAFSHLAGMHDFEMADPGERFQITDVVVEPGLPWRRLLFAGLSTGKYFIHYEEGGIGHSYSVAVFTIDSERKVTFLWGGPAFRGADDLKQLRTMVTAGDFMDDQAYAW
jgi:hypothetical protein